MQLFSRPITAGVDRLEKLLSELVLLEQVPAGGSCLPGPRIPDTAACRTALPPSPRRRGHIIAASFEHHP